MISDQFITDLWRFTYGLWPLWLQLGIISLILGVWFRKRMRDFDRAYAKSLKRWEER